MVYISGRFRTTSGVALPPFRTAQPDRRPCVKGRCDILEGSLILQRGISPQRAPRTQRTARRIGAPDVESGAITRAAGSMGTA